MAVRVDALIRVPATTGIVAHEKISGPFPLRDIGGADAGTDQGVVADSVQGRKPEMTGALTHFDRSTCPDETIMEWIIDHITSKENGSDRAGVIRG